MRNKIEVEDLIRNPENGLVGILKKEEGRKNYYVDGEHEYAGKWQTAGGSLKIIRNGNCIRKGIIKLHISAWHDNMKSTSDFTNNL
ncbi:hypothetical protein HF078_06750 [Bacillus sp. RO2]|uniref:hypothetical protein n=1 Tax=Bacillus sp. RO2 TaxID=2723913 RepID=UPI00145C5CDC|nr:hypothetical protein [Bacillus sp. RO2]NMH72765.1 hypothetical protein [Bacillus sp. RO2]